jgi:hypothetical protein
MTPPFKVICTVSIAFDTPSYQNAGEKLDQIDRKLTKILDGHGHHEITSFQTRPCNAVKFDRYVNDSQEAMAMPEPEPMTSLAEPYPR